MAQELIYTSAKRGLRPGTRGFCTVAYSEGMRPEGIRFLESLSAYTSLYTVHDSRTGRNPVSHSHCRYTLCGRNVSVLSRVAPATPDHTHRSNIIAHHVVVSNHERSTGGPAWLCSQDGFFQDSWEGEPHKIQAAKAIPEGDSTSTFAAEWETLTGDAGWAGVLAYAFLSRPTAPAFIVFEPGMMILPLLVEALALIPPASRWQVTFNTYFSSLTAGTTCCWRCCVPGSDSLREAGRNPRAVVIDLTGPLGAPPENSLLRHAREGLPLPTGTAASPGRRTRFVTLPNRNRDMLRMRTVKREDNRTNDTGTGTGSTNN